jgi:hypothetical protein
MGPASCRIVTKQKVPSVAKAQHQLWSFVRRVDELLECELLKINQWVLFFGDDTESSLPSRDNLIAFLGFFRQFFLHTTEPVYVASVIEAFRLSVNDPELLDAVAHLAVAHPFEFGVAIEVDGKSFTQRDWVEAWISRYLHSDRIPRHLEDLQGEDWDIAVMPLGLTFDRGVKILAALRGLIHEAHKRGRIPGFETVK